MIASHASFTLIESRRIEELGTTANLFEHTHTKARVLSLVNSDENKAFSVTFRTPPTDSTGVAHILEHSVLCGSKKYPLKEPFLELIKGSLHTFLNAFTYPDKTSYPVASTNLADFYHLVDVYLDAVFFPLLSRETLMQEGWHVHQEKPGDPLSYRGVVFNEMKGAFNSPDRNLYDAIFRSLLPDTTYAHESGGDPLAIPDLTYENFIAFHKRFYHPSNALFYFSGNDPEAKRLELLDALLRSFTHQKIDASIAMQPTFHSPVRLESTYGIGADEDNDKKGMVTLNWVVGDHTDDDGMLRLSLLIELLTGTSAAPLHKELINSGLGSDIAGGGLEVDVQQPIFSIGLKGMNPQDADKLETLILTTLKDLATKGFSSELIQATLNSTEFALREQNSGSFPRGLNLLYGILPTWMYGGNPLEALAFEDSLTKLKAELASGVKVFEPLIQSLLLGNTHRSTVVLTPDKTVQTQREVTETTRLKSIAASLDDAGREEIIANTLRLQTLQDTPDSQEALATLPRLTLKDLEPTVATIPTTETTVSGVPLLTHTIPTNEIMYLDLGFDLHAVPAHLLPYLPLFTSTLTHMGTTTSPFDTFIHRIQTAMGGFSTQLFAGTTHEHTTTLQLIVRTKWLTEHEEDALSLIREALLTSNYHNKTRFDQILAEQLSESEQSVLEAGHSYAASLLSSHFTKAGAIGELWNGISQIQFLNTLKSTPWETIENAFKQLRELILTSKGLTLNLTCDKSDTTRVTNHLESWVTTLPTSEHSAQPQPETSATQSQAIVVPTTVNYVGKAMKLDPKELTGAAILASHLLRSGYLWEQVRMKGGAYGAFSSLDIWTGIFSLMSYRDPHIEETLTKFDHAGEALKTLKLTADEMTTAIIGTINDVDQYMLPSQKSMVAFTRHLLGTTDAYRQTVRDAILKATLKDIHHVGELISSMKTQGIIALTTGEVNGKKLAKQGYTILKTKK